MKRRSLESGNKLGIMISDDDILVDDIEDIEDDATQLFEHFRIDADKDNGIIVLKSAAVEIDLICQTVQLFIASA